jgi:hypothetical protein
LSIFSCYADAAVAAAHQLWLGWMRRSLAEELEPVLVRLPGRASAPQTPKREHEAENVERRVRAYVIRSYL